ncbi:hypothetical protein VWM78_09685, partial [Campylobacter coli]
KVIGIAFETIEKHQVNTRIISKTDYRVIAHENGLMRVFLNLITHLLPVNRARSEVNTYNVAGAMNFDSYRNGAAYYEPNSYEESP